MQAVDLYAAAEQFIAGDRGIDAAGKQQRDLAGHPQRIPAQSRVGLGGQVGGVLPDRDLEVYLGVVEIDFRSLDRIEHRVA